MNVLPVTETGGVVTFRGQPVTLEGKVSGAGGRTELGIRPEFVSISDAGIEAQVRKVSDVGRHSVVEAVVGDTTIRAVTEGALPGQGDTVHLAFTPRHTRLYRDGWIATEASG